MPGSHDDSDHPTRTVPLTICLSKDDMHSLRNLAEIYHASPERVAASWLAHEINRRVAEMTSLQSSDADQSTHPRPHRRQGAS